MNQKSKLKSIIKQLMPPLLLEPRKKRYRRQLLQLAGANEHNARFVLPVQTIEQIFPGIENMQISTFVSQIKLQNEYAMPLAEMLTLSAIARQAKPSRLFEFGTFSGSTTLALASNTSGEAETWTLDLEDSPEIGVFIKSSQHDYKIHQMFGNSLSYDYTPFHGKMDFVLVDADHSYLCVKSDSEQAFKMLRPGGIIVWDDYLWSEHVGCAGVTRCLNELRHAKRIVQIEGTRLAIYVENDSTSKMAQASP